MKKPIELDLQEIGIDNISAMKEKKEKKENRANARKVSEEITGLFEAPKDINKFLTLIHPNLKAYVLSRGISKNDASEVISDFVLSLLTKGRDGKTRYLKYDGSRNVEYHKWIISTLNFFVKSYFKKAKLIGERELQLGDPETCQEGEFNQTHQAYLNHSEATSIDPVKRLEAKEALSLSIEITKEHVFSDFAKASIPKLVNFLKEGYSKVEIAEKLEVSPCTISKWTNLWVKYCGEVIEHKPPFA